MKGIITEVSVSTESELKQLLTRAHGGEGRFTLDHLIRTPTELFYEKRHDFSDQVRKNIPPLTMVYMGHHARITAMRVDRIRELLENGDLANIDTSEYGYLERLTRLHREYGHCSENSWRREHWGSSGDARMFSKTETSFSFITENYPLGWIMELVRHAGDIPNLEVCHRPVGGIGRGGIARYEFGDCVVRIPVQHGAVPKDTLCRRN